MKRVGRIALEALGLLVMPFAAVLLVIWFLFDILRDGGGE